MGNILSSMTLDLSQGIGYMWSSIPPTLKHILLEVKKRCLIYTIISVADPSYGVCVSKMY